MHPSEPPLTAVLLVGVDEDVSSALAPIADTKGMRTVAAASEADARTALSASDLALAIVDVDAPGIDAGRMVELVHATDRTRVLPILLVGSRHAHVDVSNADEAGPIAEEAGPIDVVTKPIDPALLRSKVATFVELHRQKQSLASRHAELEDIRRLGDLFVSVLGHDLRGPLQSVELGAQVILGKLDDPATVARMAQTTQRASRRMARLIEQLVDFARVRLQGAIRVLPSACNVEELVRTVVAELDPPAAARVTVATQGDLQVTWDRERIAQMLRNVIGNAVQHGEPETPITIAAAADADHVEIEIVNRGEVPPELLPVLFDAPVRTENGHTRKGLGLYIVDHIVKAHGGVIAVTSTAPDGTRFTIELPRHVPSTAV